jgi:hypothetical protein
VKNVHNAGSVKLLYGSLTKIADGVSTLWLCVFKSVSIVQCMIKEISW